MIYKLLLLIPCFLTLNTSVMACSMFKLSDHNSTVIGCNHDAWVTEPQLKFTNTGYGCVFTGATRYNGKIAPQSGMNEHGLVFTTLSIYPPKNVKDFKGKPITDRTSFLESVLQNCKTLEEVESYYSQYNRSMFLRDLFVYIDTSGRVLFVEPFLIHYSNESTLIQSNFCPSETPDKDQIKLGRFVRGNDFIALGYKPEIPFARSMINEMKECRKRHGDGTLISTVWDNKNLNFEVIFYHNFDSILSFNLKTELLKGDTIYNLERLFPENEEFEHLKAYKTPFNTPQLRLLLALIGGMSGLLAFWFFFQVFCVTGHKRRWWYFLQAVSALLLLGYCYVMATDIAMFYYPWPYNHPQLWWRTVLGFAPLLNGFTFFINLLNISRRYRERHISLIAISFLYLLISFGFLYWSF